MVSLNKLAKHPFVLILLDDDAEFDSKLDDSQKPTELEYYVRNCVFFTVHTLSLLEQLQDAVKLLSNYNYKKENDVGRGNHLTYNVENYIIRSRSISDRILQTINAVFHLGIDEKDVSERIVLNNIKVSRTEINKHFKEFKKNLFEFTGERNTIIHRHSYIDNELFRIEKLYHPILTELLIKNKTSEEIKIFKQSRQRYLTEFIKKTKKDFKKNNEVCFEKIIPLFDILEVRYKKMKTRL